MPQANRQFTFVCIFATSPSDHAVTVKVVSLTELLNATRAQADISPLRSVSIRSERFLQPQWNWTLVIMHIRSSLLQYPAPEDIQVVGTVAAMEHWQHSPHPQYNYDVHFIGNT